MLLSYSIYNFKSIKLEQKISFKPNKSLVNDDKKLLMNDKILPVVVIYGANGGGKTSILESVVLLNAIINAPDAFALRSWFEKLQAFKNTEIPNQDTKWKLEFLVDNNIVYKYNISVSKLGIEFEELIKYVNDDSDGELIFRKSKKKLELNDELNNLKLKTENIFHPLLVHISSFSNNRDIELVLQELRKIYSFSLESYDIFAPSFNPNYLGFNWNFNIKILEEKKEIFLKIFKEIDVNIVDIEILKNQASGYFINFIKERSFGKYKLPFSFESKGTQKIIKFLCDFIEFSKIGGMFCIDELDASLHPKLLAYIIELFHSKMNNNLQLLFTSHDMYTLDQKFFRKDEIYFARLNEAFFTDLICLDEYKNTKKDKSYSKDYIDGNIGYEPFISKVGEWDE